MMDMRSIRILLLAGIAALLAALLAAPLVAAPTAPGARAFGIARLKYGGGGDWYGDQTSLRNLMAALRQRTSIPLSGDDAAVVEPGSATLFQFPFVFAAGHGNIKFTDAEGANLRRWLEAGGFLWVDDDFGLAPSFRREMKKLFPDAELVELPFDHPIFHEPYEFAAGLPKVHEHDGGDECDAALPHPGTSTSRWTSPRSTTSSASACSARRRRSTRWSG